MKSLLFVCIVATCLVHSTFAYLETKREWPMEKKKKLMIDRINNFQYRDNDNEEIYRSISLFIKRFLYTFHAFLLFET